MKINELKERVSLFEYIQSQGHTPRKVGANTYRIDPCPVCNRKDHFTIYPETNSYNSFSDCVNGGSIYDYLQEVEGLSKEEAYKKLCELANVPQKKDPVMPRITEPCNQKTEPVSKSILTDDFKNYYTNLISNPEKMKYLESRGITGETIKRYRLGYGDIKDTHGNLIRDVIIFPNLDERGNVRTWQAEYNREKTQRKYHKTKPDLIYNEHYLTQNNALIFVTEGIYDMLSIEQLGHKAISINGVNNMNKLAPYLNNNTILVIAFDNDKVGRLATERLTAELEPTGRPVISLDLGNYNDPNEYLVSDPKGLKKALLVASEKAREQVEEQKKKYQEEHSIRQYFINDFENDLKAFNSRTEDKTGFRVLDGYLNGIHAGLYVLGGMSGTGKTTLLHQISDYLALTGHTVFYVSLEQGKFEIASKSIVREAHKLNKSMGITRKRLTTLKMTAEENKLIRQAKNRYINQYADRLNIIEGNFNFNLIRLEEMIILHRRMTGKPPIIVIDYLQILPPLAPNLSDKQAVDTNVTALKRIARDYQTAVFVVSSMNRKSYSQAVNYDSFKESGGIEYTADVLIGLHNGLWNSYKFQAKSEKKQMELLKASNEVYPKKLELVILKNRFAESNKSVLFNFYYQAEYLEETTENYNLMYLESLAKKDDED